MTYSNLLDRYSRLAAAAGRSFPTARLPAAVVLAMALTLMAGLRERLELSRVPDVSQGAAMTLMLAGLLSLAFMGFAGLGGQHA